MQVRNVEWVVKISKLCNLRCTYCYEFPFLGNPERMRLDDLARMFGHIADYYAEAPKRMDFVWHGGEPLLIEPEYYQQIVERQHAAFDPVRVPFTNSVQTNLTTLNDKVMGLIQSGFFGNIGVSLDLFGDQRVNVAGKPSQSLVLQNMQRLIDAGISFGCITVLSQVTAPHIEAIYHFFEEIDTSFRLLPVYRTGYEHQQDALALTDREIVAAFKKVVDLWLASDRNIQVRPIEDYITNAVWKLDRVPPRSHYDKLQDEVVYIVNTDGSLFSVADPPDMNLCHGNIFQSPLGDLKRSAGYLRAVQAAQDRMHATCSNCNYFGICSGYFMGEATPEQRHMDANGRLTCGVVQPMQEYIERRLIELGVFDQHTGWATDIGSLRQKLSNAAVGSFTG